MNTNYNYIADSRNNAYTQDIFDPTTDNSLVTLNPNYISAERIEAYTKSYFVNMPPSYAETSIIISYNNIVAHTIPVLFLGDVGENWSTNFIKENPVGSTYPILAFSNTGNTTINVSFEVLSDYLPVGYNSFTQYIDALRMMTKPRYSGDEVQAPRVKIALPGLSFSGVCDSLGIQYSQIYGNNSYVHATVTCTFTIDSLNGIKKQETTVENVGDKTWTIVTNWGSL